MAYTKRFNSYYTAESATLGESINKAKNNNLILDNICNWYIFEDEVRMGFSLLRKYENLIFSNAIEVPFEPSWKYKPEYASFDIYGTTDFWYFILFLNRIESSQKFDFTGSTILVPADELLETLEQIFLKEDRMKNTLNNPIRIYKHYLKKLDEPSKQVLPSDYDAELDGLTSFKEYKDITNEFLDENNFIHMTEGYSRGILKTEFLDINNREVKKYKMDKYTNPNYYKMENYEDEYFGTGLQKIINENDTININKTGFLRPFKTGYYKFRLFSSAGFQMYLDEENVLDYKPKNLHIIPDMKYIKNLFEEYSNNSDFKRRNFDYWNVDTSLSKDTPVLQYDTVLNKTLLDINITEKNIDSINNMDIFKIKIPINGIREEVNFDDRVTFENDGDIYYRIDYRLPLGRKNAKLVMKIKFMKGNKDNVLIKEITKTSESFNLNRNPQTICSEFIKIDKELINKNEVTSVILSLAVICPKLDEYSDKIKREGSISRIHIDKVYFYTLEDKYYELEDAIYLDKDHIYDFKSICEQVYNDPYKFFNLEYAYLGESKENSDYEYKRIPMGWFFVKNPKFNGIEDYNSYQFKEYLDFYNDKSLDDYYKSIDDISNGNNLINNEDKIVNIFDLVNKLGGINNNHLSYFMNNQQNLIRLNIYNNTNRELLEEYFVENIESGYDILNEFNLKNDNTNYRLSFMIPLNEASYFINDNYLNFKSFSNYKRNMENIIIKDNKENRINLYLFSSPIMNNPCFSYKKANEVYDCNTDNNLLNYKLLGQKNDLDSSLILNINNIIDNKFIEKNIPSALVIEIVTNEVESESYNINFEIKENEIDLLDNELNISDYIPDFLNQDYIEMIYKINWFKLFYNNNTNEKYNSPIQLNDLNKEISETINGLHNSLNGIGLFILDEFIKMDLENKYEFNRFLLNLNSINGLFDESIYLPKIYSYNPAIKNKMMRSINIFPAFMPENFSSNIFFQRSLMESDKSKKILQYIKILDDYNKTQDYGNNLLHYMYSTGLYEGKFRQFLFSPLKNVKYTMLSKNKLEDDFVIKIKFKKTEYVKYEISDKQYDSKNNNNYVLSTKQGIFGIIFDYNDGNKYAFIVNLYENYNDNIKENQTKEEINTKYIKTGFYKYNNNFVNDSYLNEKSALDWFRERFQYIDILDKERNILFNNLTNPEKEKLTKKINDKMNFNCLLNVEDNMGQYKNDKIIKIMNYRGWLSLEIIDDKGNSELLAQINDNKNKAYNGGNLGFFSINMDGINIEMKLFN